MRPPLRTSEIHAYNYGVRVRESGAGLDALASPALIGVLLPFGAPEEQAEDELGPPGFRAWAVRGWLERNDLEVADA